VIHQEGHDDFYIYYDKNNFNNKKHFVGFVPFVVKGICK